MAIPLLRVPRTTIRPTVCSVHMSVRIAHSGESHQAEPAVVRLAYRTLDVEAAVDPDARRVASRAEFAADARQVLA
jgi:hypothetical protein